MECIPLLPSSSQLSELQAQLRESESQSEVLSQQLQTAHQSLESREAEITLLSREREFWPVSHRLPVFTQYTYIHAFTLPYPLFPALQSGHHNDHGDLSVQHDSMSSTYSSAVSGEGRRRGTVFNEGCRDYSHSCNVTSGVVYLYWRDCAIARPQQNICPLQPLDSPFQRAEPRRRSFKKTIAKAFSRKKTPSLLNDQDRENSPHIIK